MIVSDSYYTCGIKEKKRNGIIKSVLKDKPEKGIYVVILPVYGKDLLEIYEYNKLLDIAQKAELQDICVVGFAKDYDCATDLVTEIVQDVYGYSGSKLDVRQYFKNAASGETEIEPGVHEETEETEEG